MNHNIFENLVSIMKSRSLPMEIKGDLIEFLQKEYSGYLNSLKRIKAYKEEKEEMEKILFVVENSSNKIIQLLKFHREGKISECYNQAYMLFDSLIEQLPIATNKNNANRLFDQPIPEYNSIILHNPFYRGRIDYFKDERKELFHVPIQKRELIKQGRYSIPGYPCLYLSNDPVLCWYECGEPEKITMSKFEISSTQTLKLIDFSAWSASYASELETKFLDLSNMQCDTRGILNILKRFICSYPLELSCSIIGKSENIAFREEYAIPQLLLQWVREKERFDGIKYRSCSSVEGDVINRGASFNIVLPTKKFRKDGLCENLTGMIKVSSPYIFKIGNDERKMMDRIPFENSIKDDYMKI